MGSPNLVDKFPVSLHREVMHLSIADLFKNNKEESVIIVSGLFIDEDAASLDVKSRGLPMRLFIEQINNESGQMVLFSSLYSIGMELIDKGAIAVARLLFPGAVDYEPDGLSSPFSDELRKLLACEWSWIDYYTPECVLSCRLKYGGDKMEYDEDSSKNVKNENYDGVLVFPEISFWDMYKLKNALGT